MPGYQSPLASNATVIDDSNFWEFVEDPVIDGDRKTRGRIPRDYHKEPYGSLPFAATFPSELLVPWEEMDEEIKRKDMEKSWITDLLDQAGLTVLDQDGTNYCWINAPVHCVEIMRVVQGEQMVRLSPASCGGPIKNYRNVGGWGTEGLAYIVEKGIVPIDLWPANHWQNDNYDTEESREARLRFKIQEWIDGEERSAQQALSMAIHNIPSALGYNWWAHEVTGVRAIAFGNKKYGLEIDNSWGRNWGTNGRGVLSGTKYIPDDLCGPRVVSPSFN